MAFLPGKVLSNYSHIGVVAYIYESTMILRGPILLAIGLLYRLGFGATLMANIMISFAGAGGNRTPQSVFTVLSLVTSLCLTSLYKLWSSSLESHFRMGTCTSFSIDPYLLLKLESGRILKRSLDATTY